MKKPLCPLALPAVVRSSEPALHACTKRLALRPEGSKALGMEEEGSRYAYKNYNSKALPIHIPSLPLKLDLTVLAAMRAARMATWARTLYVKSRLCGARPDADGGARMQRWID